jgi:hypothetical protein
MTLYLSRIILHTVRNTSNKCMGLPEHFSSQCRLLSHKSALISLPRLFASRNYSSDNIQPTLALENSSMPLKKKLLYKKATLDDLTKKDGHYLTLAYVTANSYDLKGLKEALVQQKLYEPAM